MQKYKQTSISGESYIRSNEIVIRNPLGGNPAIVFAEEQVINAGDEEIRRVSGNCTETLTAENHEESFALRNPQTGDLLGTTATYTEFATLLYSLYWHVAEKRDNLSVEEENA